MMTPLQFGWITPVQFGSGNNYDALQESHEAPRVEQGPSHTLARLFKRGLKSSTEGQSLDFMA